MRNWDVTASYLEDQLRERHFEIAEQLMAHFTLERIAKAVARPLGIASQRAGDPSRR